MRIAILVAVIAIAIGAWMWSSRAAAPVPSQPAPRFADRDENESASRLMATVARFDARELREKRELAIDYIAHEVKSSAPTCDPPPARLASFLTKHAVELRTIRALLASEAAPVWKMRPNDIEESPEPDLTMVMHLFSLFAADALSAHNASNDAVAWSDVGAMWVLARSLWNRPDSMSILTALSGSRILNAVATKLPSPAPRWWPEFASFDPKPRLQQALSYEAWAIRARAEKYPVGEPDDDTNGLVEAVRKAAEPFVRPVRLVQADERAQHLHSIAQTLASADPCTELPPSTRPWMSILLRMNRFIIEREGVSKVLAAEEQKRMSGAWPAQIDSRSACPRVGWKYQRAGAGMELTFSGQLPTPQTRIVAPLTYRR